MKFHVLSLQKWKDYQTSSSNELKLWNYRQKELLNTEKKTLLLRNTRKLLFNTIQYILHQLLRYITPANFTTYSLDYWWKFQNCYQLSVRKHDIRFNRLFNETFSKTAINISRNGRNIRYCVKLRIIHVQTI